MNISDRSENQFKSFIQKKIHSLIQLNILGLSTKTKETADSI